MAGGSVFDFLIGDRPCGPQIGSRSDKLNLVVAVLVFVSSLVSIWCPDQPRN